jgi:arylsulfatase A-like enzyme
MAVSPDTDPDLIVGARQVFAGQLTRLDEQVGRLLDAVNAAGGGWTVLIAGLRGLPLGLHGWLGTGGRPLPFGELVHVPAILVEGGERMAGQRFMGLVTPADLGVTLGELAGGEAVGRHVAADRPWSGRSLAGLFEDWGAPERDRIVVADAAGTAFVTPTWHAILPSVDAGLAVRFFSRGPLPRPEERTKLHGEP